MAEPTAAPPVTDTKNLSLSDFTIEEQVTASVALYSLSLFCIVVGSIRSVEYVLFHIRKKRLIEGSIGTSDAKKFPISASLVLFSLYLVFKPAHERFAWVPAVAQKIYVPEHYVNQINATLINWFGDGSNSTSASPSVPFYARMYSKLPSQAQEFVNPHLESAQVYAQPLIERVPSIGRDEIMFLLTLFICWEGLCAIASNIRPVTSFLLKKLPLVPSSLSFNTPYLFSLKKGNAEMEEGDIEEASNSNTEYIFKMEINKHELFSLIICAPILYSHLTNRHWITNNIFGIAFSILGIERLHLNSFKAGAFLLFGLFFYDIFWVFGTDVMTSVARGINAPILLQFPLDIYRNGAINGVRHSMLGLGDIVIPGAFIALLRRFDSRIIEKKDTKNKTVKASRYFFWITVLAYAIGLLITMYVMHIFKAAQPALLYLVPCCLIVPLLVASCTGELSALWNYDESYLVQKQKKVDDAKKNN